MLRTRITRRKIAHKCEKRNSNFVRNLSFEGQLSYIGLRLRPTRDVGIDNTAECLAQITGPLELSI
jgi:hypothetical protein